MKIIFLCGSLEIGRDGVGDYVRRLCGELIRQNHQVSAIAINDQKITEELIEIQHSENVDIKVLRLPSILIAKQRFSRAKAWINEYNPDWLSLQYVPFSFHPKGLSIKLNKQLTILGKGRKWHVMFHELWVGMAQEDSKKLVYWGWLQRQLIKLLLINLKPALIHTQTRLYQQQLAKLGYKASYLPLFSNIPVLNVSKKINTKKLNIVTFGALHHGAPITHFATEIAQYAREQHLDISLLITGRVSSEKQYWIKVWEAAGLSAELLGELPSENISQILSDASIGLSTTPILLTEKSGSVVAMREHGLIVLCVSRAWQPRDVTNLQTMPGIIEYCAGNLKTSISRIEPSFFPVQGVGEISRELIKALEATV